MVVVVVVVVVIPRVLAPSLVRVATIRATVFQVFFLFVYQALGLSIGKAPADGLNFFRQDRCPAFGLDGLFTSVSRRI